MKQIMGAAAVLLVAAAAVQPNTTPDRPPLPTEQPEFFAAPNETPPNETPPLPNDEQPEPEPEPADQTLVDPSRVGLVREGEGTKIVAFLRPIGIADSCEVTTCNAEPGTLWLSKNERTFIKLRDGTFRLRQRAKAKAKTKTVERVVTKTVAAPACANGVCRPAYTTGYVVRGRTVQFAGTPPLPDAGGGGYGSVGSGVRRFGIRSRWRSRRW